MKLIQKQDIYNFYEILSIHPSIHQQNLEPQFPKVGTLCKA